MINHESIYQSIKECLPAEKEDLIVYLTAQAEQQIDIMGKDIIRRLVSQRTGKEPALFLSRIDTKV